MVASLLRHRRRTAKRFTAQRASGTICVALTSTRGPTLANLEADPFGPRLRKAAAAQSTSKGLYGGTSFRKLVFVPSDPLKQLGGVLVLASP